MIPRFKPELGWQEIRALFRRNRGAVERFEKEFAAAFQAVDAVAFPYGRSAQWAFLKAIGLQDAEIIMPAYTCSVVAHAVTLSGNIPRFIDITLDDYNMDLDAAEAAINDKTRAIIATHTFGYPQDLDRLEAMVKQAEDRYGHKVWLIQDCCHAFGAEWNGRMIGTSGDVAIYAFNVSKIITSVFGGMLTFQNKSLAGKIRAWRDQTFTPPKKRKEIQRRLYLLAVCAVFNKHAYKLVWRLQNQSSVLDHWTRAYHLDDRIHFPPDYLQQMTNFEAEIGIRQLTKYQSIIARRRKLARFYHQELAGARGWALPPIVPGATYSHYAVRVPDRSRVISDYAQRGIELGELIQYSIPALPAYADSKCRCPLAEMASKETINFPTGYPTKRPRDINISPEARSTELAESLARASSTK